MLPPEVILALFSTFAPIVREIIAKFQNENNGELPTDEQMIQIFNDNADRILAEGAAWKAQKGRL